MGGIDVNHCIVRVAIPTPLRRCFDYLPPLNTDCGKLLPGIRVSVPFGKRNDVVGLVLQTAAESHITADRLKPVNNIIDEQPVIDGKLLRLLNRASCYYHHPIGEVVFHAMPVWLRKGNTFDKLEAWCWQLTDSGKLVNPDDLKRSPKQAQIINYLQQTKTCNEGHLLHTFHGCKPILKKIAEKGWIKKTRTEANNKNHGINQTALELNKHQQQAIKRITESLGGNKIFLLNGLTCSGKTEVYMAAIEKILSQGQQSLVLLPEIGLTPQLIQRFKQRFQCQIAIQHSRLDRLERARYWLAAKNGQAKIVLGTRSAIWTPLANPGLFIADEEHDLSYKQQDGFRYSAKDMLLLRAQYEQIPVVLGSATPSLESLLNVERGKFEQLILPSRAGSVSLPDYKLIDIRGKKMHGALSQVLINEIQQHLGNKNQVLLFLNRRGYANYLICHTCGWKAVCEHCELPYTYHKSINRLVCHHCESRKKNMALCPECHTSLGLIGHGTERIEEVLRKHFPGKHIVRIDRDTTRRKNAMSSALEQIYNGAADILIGTQMLAKGHHFPDVTLTAIVDADHGLFSVDFRASERLAQLLMQVSGRTGRGYKTGTVLIQTYHPQHKLFRQLIDQGYTHYAHNLLYERKLSSLPPYAYTALLTAEAHNVNDGRLFLDQANTRLKSYAQPSLSIFGPMPAMIEKRNGRYRLQLVLQAASRKQLHKHLNEWLLQLESMKLSKKVRWYLDIDPQDAA